MSGMPQIIVGDIGNSAIKLAIAQRNDQGVVELSNKLQWLHGDFNAAELERWAPSEEMHWCIASVHRSKTEMLKEWISSRRPNHHVQALTFTNLPLKILVDAPEKVGIDRLLSAVAANHRRGDGEAAITITAGTAVTVNAIDEQGAFLGGAILPGWPLLAKALHQYTDALPLVNDLCSINSLESTTSGRGTRDSIQAIGKNTQDAIRSGLYFGLLGAISRLIGEYESLLRSKAEIFYAGGDASPIHHAIGRGVLAPDLVLEGVALAAFAGVATT